MNMNLCEYDEHRMVDVYFETYYTRSALNYSVYTHNLQGAARFQDTYSRTLSAGMLPTQSIHF